ncbi:MAG: hypothetical protein HKN85_00270, partial [Gammaproteobacteria bacterium]|nr:hypothetical protein [Gammaproteobacteria bacterium]
MSTILDALRKSEQERKLNKLPTLSDLPTPQEQSRWPQILIIALLMLVLLVLTWFGSRWWVAKPLSEDSRQSTILLNNETIGTPPPAITGE